MHALAQAVNTVDFFNQVNMLYGTVTEFCTAQTCASMSAGPKCAMRVCCAHLSLPEPSAPHLARYEYHWADGLTVKKAIKCSAPEYVEFLMSWVQTQLDDESMFPSKIGRLATVVNWTTPPPLKSVWH